MNQVCITNTPDLHTQAAQASDHRKSPPLQPPPPPPPLPPSSLGSEDWIHSTNLNVFSITTTESTNKWHPHVYAPVRHPTPHSIMDILGWKEPEEVQKTPPMEQGINHSSNNNNHSVPYLLRGLDIAAKEVDLEDQPLDLCIAKSTPYEKHLEEGKEFWGFMGSGSCYKVVVFLFGRNHPRIGSINEPRAGPLDGCGLGDIRIERVPALDEGFVLVKCAARPPEASSTVGRTDGGSEKEQPQVPRIVGTTE